MCCGGWFGGCVQKDSEHQAFACICFHMQCGVCPIKCCQNDANAFCWGCVCCRYQIDPCFCPRQLLDCVCTNVPCCGCCAKDVIMIACCCNPGTRSIGADDQAKIDAFNKQQKSVAP